jgi:dimethylargininase
MTSTRTRAIVRSLPATFDRSIRPPGSIDPIDLARARRQHDAYVAVLSGQGIDVTRIAAADRYPDCCFVEDPAVVVGEDAIICEMAAPSRRGEGAPIERELARHTRIHRMRAPATMDGGDVIRMGTRVFVGISERTNAAAVEQLRAMVTPAGYTVTPVAVEGVLHLKSACTPLDDETLLVDDRRVDTTAFGGLRRVGVPPEEGYAANALALARVVVVSARFPRTRERVEEAVAPAGREVVELDMSEFRKAGGSLTCLSILLT